MCSSSLGMTLYSDIYSVLLLSFPSPFLLLPSSPSLLTPLTCNQLGRSSPHSLLYRAIASPRGNWRHTSRYSTIHTAPHTLTSPSPYSHPPLTLPLHTLISPFPHIPSHTLPTHTLLSPSHTLLSPSPHTPSPHTLSSPSPHCHSQVHKEMDTLQLDQTQSTLAPPPSVSSESPEVARKIKVEEGEATPEQGEAKVGHRMIAS